MISKTIKYAFLLFLFCSSISIQAGSACFYDYPINLEIINSLGPVDLYDYPNPIVTTTFNENALLEALARRGRLEKPIEMKLPGFDDRKEFFRRKLAHLVTAEPIDVDRLSHLTEGQTYYAINGIIHISLFAVIVYHKTLSQELLEQNIDRQLHNSNSADSTESTN